jgi:hypothetical protein
MIDPYNLLGITHMATIKEVKTAYYNMCLLLHPDRGGTNEDMAVLQNAYEYVYEQISKAISSPPSLEKLESDFKAFCLNQEQLPPPSFRDIFDDIVFDTKEFNAQFDGGDMGECVTKRVLCPASIHTGHGEWMAEGGCDSIESNTKNASYTYNSIQQYIDPIPTMSGSKHMGSVDVYSTPLDDFTINEKTLLMGDCKLVYVIEKIKELHQQKPRTLEMIIEERENDDMCSLANGVSVANG